MVLKTLMLKKISLKCVCVLFLVLALEFLLMTTRTRNTLAVQSGAAVLGWSSGSGGQGCFRKMPNPATRTARCQSCGSERSQAAGAPVCTRRGKTKVVTGLYQNTTVGDGFSLSSWGSRTDLEGFSLQRRKLSDGFSGACWISLCWSAGWSFLTKGRWRDGLSRAVALVQCESNELEQRSCPAKPGLFATEIPASNCSFNDLYDRQRKHHCLLSLL